jgi:hypothetical protein
MLFSSLFLAIACVIAAPDVSLDDEMVPRVNQTQFSSIPSDLRGLRYCEFIPMFRYWFDLRSEIYNTVSFNLTQIGCNTCPKTEWNALLQKDGLAKKYAAMLVKLNGPRYFLMNRISYNGVLLNGTSIQETKTIQVGGIQMKKWSHIRTKIWEGSYGTHLYTDNAIHRPTIWMYNAGAALFSLHAPNGDRYVMHSYSQIVDKKLAEKDLFNLGSRLKMPKGWKYMVSKLNNTLELSSQGLAYVITDDFYNSYQKVTHLINHMYL